MMYIGHPCYADYATPKMKCSKNRKRWEGDLEGHGFSKNWTRAAIRLKQFKSAGGFELGAGYHEAVLKTACV